MFDLFQFKDYEYYGLKNGDECHCGNNNSHFFPTYRSHCNKRCQGDRTQFCGNNWRFNIFRHIDTTKVSTANQTTDFKSTSFAQTTISSTTTTTTTTTPHFSLLHISGSISTNRAFSDDFLSKNNENYTNLKNVTEIEIKSILESNHLVENAFVSVTGIITANLNRQKRSTENAVVEFISTCSVRVPELEDMDAIESTVSSTIKNADSSLYKSFDENSFSSINLSFAEPRIIEFNAPSKEEIKEKIGMNSCFQFKELIQYCILQLKWKTFIQNQMTKI